VLWSIVAAEREKTKKLVGGTTKWMDFFGLAGERHQTLEHWSAHLKGRLEKEEGRKGNGSGLGSEGLQLSKGTSKKKSGNAS